MELIQHEILDTGSSKSFHYYTLSCGFDINPNNGDTARDMFFRIRQIIGERAEVQDDIAIRVFKNDPAFRLDHYEGDIENIAVSQYLFSVSAHNNGWTVETLVEALSAARPGNKLKPRKDHVVFEWYQSLRDGVSFSIKDDADEYIPLDKWDIKYSKTQPTTINDGANGQLWVVPDYKGVLNYFYRTNNKWLNITPVIVVSTSEPSAGQDYWFDVTGLKARIGDEVEYYREEEYDVVLGSNDFTEIRIEHTASGTVAYLQHGSVWRDRPIDGNIVFDEFTWFSNTNSDMVPTYSIGEQNDALQGASDIQGGAVDIYNYTFAPENLIGTATALVFVDGDQRAYPGASEGIIMVGTAPEYKSHFMSADGSNGNQSMTNIATTQAYITDSLGDFVVGNWQDTIKPATDEVSVSWSTPGEVTGFGTGSTIEVTVSGGDNIAIDRITNTEFTADGIVTASGAGATTVTISDYDTDGADQAAAKITLAINHATLLGGTSGTVKVEIKMVAADNSTEYTFSQDYFYDINNNSNPVIAGGASMAQGTTVITKHLSGIEYMTTGHTFDVSADTINGLASDASHPGNMLHLNFGEFPISDEGVQRATTGWTDLTTEYDVANVSFANSYPINELDAVYIGTNQLVFTVQDPWTTVPRSVPIDSYLIDTVADSATPLFEPFVSETFRLDDDWRTWDSTELLVQGNGLVANRRLMVPNQLMTTVGVSANASDLTGYLIAGPDYSGLDSTGGCVYRRRFTFTNQAQEFANLTINITGDFGAHADINAAMDAGDVEIFMYKQWDTDGTNNNPNLNVRPIWVHSEYDFASFDNGATQTAAGAGCRIGATSTGSAVNITFGGFSLAQSFWMLVRINSDDINLNTITVNE